VERSYKIGPEHAQAKPFYQRHDDLARQIAATKEKGAAQKGQMASQQKASEEKTAALDETWLPRIEAFIRPTGAQYIDYPVTHDMQRLAQQDATLEAAKRLLADYEKQVTGADAGPRLEKAVGDLRSAIQNYVGQRNAGVGDLKRTIEDQLGQWETRFAENKNWKEESGRSLFALSPEKFDHVRQQIGKLKTASPDDATVCSGRLAQLEKENTVWAEKRGAWENRPRPFPEAQMTSKALEKQMTDLLQDRGWKVEKLAIVDKDWWVLKGEYRYLQAAALSRDSEGPFWSFVSFKQDQNLTGYGPTELWETKKKIRLP